MKKSNFISSFLASAGIAATVYTTLKVLRNRDLRGQVVLVTGSSRGLGFQLAREFARQGSKVILCARVHEELDQAQAQFEDWGIEVLTLVCDVSDQTEVASMIEIV